MESAYLKKLSEFLQTCRYVLLYGAGGVTGDLLCLLDPYLCKEKICIVVSDQKENQSVLKGYPVKKISEFCSMQKEVYVIISAAPRYVGQMEESLKAQGFLHYCTASYLVDRIYEEIWKTNVFFWTFDHCCAGVLSVYREDWVCIKCKRAYDHANHYFGKLYRNLPNGDVL